MDGFLVNAKYEPIKRIGHGSYGSVYLARRKGAGSGQSFVVLKRVLIAEEGSKEAVEAHNEVKLLQRLRHKNIVAYKDSFVHDGALCIVMAYCAGGDVHTQIKTAREAGLRFTQDQVVDWLSQILEALAYLHEDKKILHRDLKSQNVFLVPEKAVALEDWVPRRDDPSVPRPKLKGGEELASMEANCLLHITHRTSNGWLFGVKDGSSQKGYFPASKVQMLASPGNVTVKLGTLASQSHSTVPTSWLAR